MAVRRGVIRAPATRGLGLFALVAVGYAVGAELSWQSFSYGAAFGFAPAGLTVAALLLTSRRRWPVIVAAIVVSEVGVDLQHGLSLGVALASAAANVVEPLVGASCVLRFCRGRPGLGTRRDLLRFIGGAVLLGPAAGGLIGATIFAVSQGGWWPGLLLQWVAGDGISVLVIGGPILLWTQRRELAAARWPELILVMVVSAGLSFLAYRLGMPPSLLFLPVLAWAAFRLGDLGAVLAGTAFAVVANYLTAEGYGTMARLRLPPPTELAVTQAYIAVIVLVGWLLAQEIGGRVSATADRDSARAEQELADARRAAAELGAALADAPTARVVTDQVAAAVRSRLGDVEVTVSQPGADGPGRDATGRDQQFSLVTEAGPLGRLGVRWPQPHQESAPEREYLQAVAETTSRAVERARLREAEQRERARMEMLSELTRLLAAALTPEAIGAVVTDRVRAAIGGADGLSLSMISRDRRRLEYISVTGYAEDIRAKFAGLPLSAETAVTDAARTGRPVVIRTPEEYLRRYSGRSAAAAAADGSSWLAWPLTVGSTSIGSIGLMWKQPQDFQEGERVFIAAAAGLIAQALVRARMYADEHAVAAVLQRAVMPRTTAAIPGLEIGASYRQAGESRAIGGDWYDAMALPSGGAYLALGDVVGHGIAAAEDMTQLRNAGRALAVAGYQPAALLAELDQITACATAGGFATMVAAVLDADCSVVTHAAAGHPPLLIRRAATGTVEMPPADGGPALGLGGPVCHPQYRASLAPGDVLLLYSDGLIERRGEDLHQGIDRVCERLRAWQPGTPLNIFCDQLVRSVASQPQLDDMCVLAIKRQR